MQFHSINLKKRFDASLDVDIAKLVTGTPILEPTADVYLPLLEQDRIKRLKSSNQRARLHNTLMARRLWLSNYLGVAPDAVILEHNEAGAPILKGWLPGEVSFSRSQNWCAIALSKGSRIGIDVETDRDLNWSSILDFVSVPDEAGSVREAVKSEGTLAPFFRAWCSKEALLKLLGTGFKTQPKTINLPEALIAGASNAEVVLSVGSAQVWVTRIDAMTVALAKVPR